VARRKFVAGNWKMYTLGAAGADLARAVAEGVAGSSARVAVCPPFPYLSRIADVLRGSAVELGAQDVYPAKEGAFTGEVSPDMLYDVGCRLVIVGHSERRHGLGETSEFANRKVVAAWAAGLDVVLCVGETLEERESEKTFIVLEEQLSGMLKTLQPDGVSKLTIAYEPVWAIGTGRTASPAQAQEVHSYIRGLFEAAIGREAAARLIIQYGGSVKPENARELLSQPDIDGALVGGASLKADSFISIVRAAC
jgi:triosephosphate isomerase